MTGLLNLLQDVQRILNTKNDLLGIKYKFRAIARLKNAIKQKSLTGTSKAVVDWAVYLPE